MQTVSAQMHELILDGAGFVSLQAVRNAAARDDITGFSFYVGNRYGVTVEQLKIAFDHGKLVMPNREARADEAMHSVPGPVYEIDTTRRIMDGWGLDWTAVPCIDSAVDISAVPSQFAQLDNWWHGYVDHALEVGLWGGYYGATAYGIHLTNQSWWPPNFPTWTWGGAGTIPGTAAKQFVGNPSGNDYSTIGVTVDESEIRDGLVMASSFEAANGAPPSPPGALVTVVIELSDADAVFEGELSAQGIVTFVRWIEGGRQALLKGAPFNCQVLGRGVGQLTGMTLVGPLPTGDSRHQWTGQEFYRYQPAGGGPKGDKGDPGPPFHGTVPIQGGTVTL